ncbi:hypothetical protein JAAARDRAFT_189904 [Jaapia argillacea MUCL 33604]|uniref:Zinc/iron permease n=1 Tax=Jaapia argillacea MUCL 33604 TaxID=933084 RepID=A0A067QJ07_9AGAM|nr:hypothetical protein JAAARDRAFT_189904 [Jaapia argillacea MUCL 33604]
MSGGIIILMSIALAGASYGIGVLPLSVTFSKSTLGALTALGTGLLLGAGLGIIIPEGVETLASAYAGSDFPTSTISIALLLGFTFMLGVEQFTSSHSHSPLITPSITLEMNHSKELPSLPDVEFDAELDDLEDQATHSSRHSIEAQSDIQKVAVPLTLGLFIHGLADGLALGVSSLSDSSSGGLSDLSLVVFLALLIHKAPTTLAFTMSLLSTSLSRSQCKRHLALFSASTPIGAISSYFLLSIFGAGGGGKLTGFALLVSGGSFLYVATVLQPVSDHSHPTSSGGLGRKARALVVIIGVFIPFAIAFTFDHAHHVHLESPNIISSH